MHYHISKTVTVSCSSVKICRNSPRFKTENSKSPTYQNSSGSGLSRNQFSRPILGFGHERPFELLLPLPGGLLFLLLRIVGSILCLLPAAQEGQSPPYQHDQQSGEECADAGQQEAPVLPLDEALLARNGGVVDGRERLAGRLFAGHTALGASDGRDIHSPSKWHRKGHRRCTVWSELFRDLVCRAAGINTSCRPDSARRSRTPFLGPWPIRSKFKSVTTRAAVDTFLTNFFTCYWESLDHDAVYYGTTLLATDDGSRVRASSVSCLDYCSQ